MSIFMKTVLVAGCVGVLGLVNAPHAHAAFILRLTSGTSTATIVDDGAGDITNTTPGQITFAGMVGNFTINVTTGLGNPQLPNTPYQANIHLNNVSLSSSAGGTLTIELTQTGLTLDPTAGSSIYLTSAFGGTTAGTVEAWQVLDLQNGQFADAANGEAVVHHGPLGGPSFSDNGSATTAYSGGNFSITEKVVITHSGAGTTSFDIDSLAVVPAPATSFLVLAGLPMFLGAWWARRRLIKQAA